MNTRKWVLTLALIFLCLATLVVLTEAAKKNKKSIPTTTSNDASSVEKKKDAESTRASRAAARAKQLDLLHKRLLKREERTSSRLKRARTSNEKKAKERKARYKAIKTYIENERKKIDATVKAKVSSEKPETRRKGEEKLKWMQQQSGKRSTRIIDMDPDQFKRYLNAGPRPYWTFVTLTALGAQYQCNLCGSAQSAVVKLSHTYHTHRKSVLAVKANETDITNTTLTTDALDAPPVFFVNIDVEKNRQIFDALGLQTAPTMVLLPPLTSDKNPKLSSFLSALPSKYKYAISRPDFSAEDFESFISKHTGISVKGKGIASFDTSTLIKVIALALVVITIVSLILYRHWDRFHDIVYGRTALVQSGTPKIINTGYGRALLQHVTSHRLSRRKIAIAVVAWLGYGFCISGGMYNIIRSTQWEGRNEWISGDSHDQFGIESIIIWGINLSLAFAMVIAVLRAHVTIELDTSKEEISTSTLKKILGALFLPFQFVVSYLLTPTCVVAVAWIWYQLCVIYTRKNWSYHYGWVIGQPKWW